MRLVISRLNLCVFHYHKLTKPSFNSLKINACGFCGFFFCLCRFVSFNENIPAGLNENCCIPKNQLFVKEWFFLYFYVFYHTILAFNWSSLQIFLSFMFFGIFSSFFIRLSEYIYNNSSIYLSFYPSLHLSINIFSYQVYTSKSIFKNSKILEII